MLDFNRLKTPPGDGDTLIEPSPAEWPRLISENIRLRNQYRFNLAGEPAAVAIQETRAALIEDRPVVAAGHQPAFVHPGVWAKHVVVHHAGRQFGVEGLDFVVDNDAPVSSTLTAPVIESEGLLARCEIHFSTAPAGSPYEGRPMLSHEQMTSIRQELSNLLGDRFRHSPMPEYLAACAHLQEMRPNSGEASGAMDWVAQHLAGRLAVDRPLGADLSEARVSKAFGGLFLADLLLNPEPFAVAYNQALTKYRQEQAVRSPDRPLPDLRREGDRVEVALWVYQPLQPRQRLWVRRADDRVELFAGAKAIGTLSARDLARHPDLTFQALRPWVVRPRALTLTLWARLLACDLFVHGIGGAKYDRITDEIIRRYYRTQPPAYACVSATLRLPLPVFDASPEKLRAAYRELRDWQFNPQRHLASVPADLLAERERLIARSEQLRASRVAHLDRREVYRTIHQLNARLRELAPDRESELNEGVSRLKTQLNSNEIAQSREFFYCLQPRERLERLAGRLLDGW